VLLDQLLDLLKVKGVFSLIMAGVGVVKRTVLAELHLN
jgi:hypothetical protein